MTADPAATTRPRPLPGARRVAAALAGPALIAGTGAWVMRAFLFQGRSTDSDVVTFWLPMFTELGRALGDGHIPAWTPHALAGQPFAADPHSGWAQLLPMLLFTALRPARALGLLVGLQPIIAGLGTYAFLRGERLSRAAATVAGLVLMVPIAAGRVGVTVRFPGIVAWTAISLAAASRMVRTRDPAARVGWMVLVAVAWGQAVAVHVTIGAALSTLALAAYLIPAGFRARAAGTPGRRIVRTGAALLLAMVAVNLAVLLPRGALIDGTSIAGGYDEISERSRQLTGVASPQYPGFTASPEWPVNFATVPGIYLGAAALSLAFAGWWSPRRRWLVAGFSAAGLLCWALTMEPVANLVHGTIGGVPFVDQYLHQPEWFSIGVVISVAVLAGLGVEAWRETADRRRRLLMAAPVAGWAGLALAFGARADWLLPLAAGAAVLGGLSFLPRARPRAAAGALAGLVCLELLAPFGVEFGREWRERIPPIGREPEILRPNRPARVDLERYLTPPPLAVALRAYGGRFLSLGRPNGVPTRYVRALQNNEGQLFAVESAGGYRSLQPDRTWTLLRRMHDEPIRYNRATVSAPKELYLDLMGIEWLIASRRPPNTDPATATDGWGLFRRNRVPPRASLVGAWEVAEGPEGSAARVLAPGFDPDRLVVLEARPASHPSGAEGPAGTAVFRAEGGQAATVEVDATRPAMLLIRTPYDPGWSATIDDRPAPVLVADHAIQAVPVPAGHHLVRLAYDDPSIGLGLVGSGVALVLFGWAALAATAPRRRSGPVGEEPAGPI